MKVIISHDVDHITAFEHVKDMFLPKYFVRNTIELLSGKIFFSEYCLRFSGIFKNKLNNIDELVRFDKANHIKPTFFIAVNNGLNLSYNSKNAQRWINRIVSQGIPVGVHGINFNSKVGVNQEYSKFKLLAGIKPSGIRMHYLRLNDNTLGYLDQVGYLFDASVYKLCPPYKVNNIWEFPINLMDSYLFYKKSYYQVKSLDQVKEDTIACIERAKSMNLQYFNIVTHDFYFSESFKIWKAWYIWLIEYLNRNKYEFIDFETAIKEIEYLSVTLE